MSLAAASDDDADTVVDGANYYHVAETNPEVLKAEIRHLKQLLRATQAELGEYKQKAEYCQCEHNENRAEQQLKQQKFSNNKLPTEILRLMFQYCKDNIHSLLNCRLVCKTWKYAVDDPCTIMNYLCFSIYDWRLFSQSTIIDKVRSIRICIAWNVNDNNVGEVWLQFVRKIGQTVRKIVFDFYILKCVDFYKRRLFITNSLLNACPNLKKLHILDPDLLELVTQMPDFQVGKNIDALSVKATGKVLQRVLLKFSNLVTIGVYKYSNRQENEFSPVSIRSVLCEYIAKVNNGNLKSIDYFWCYNDDVEDQQYYNLLFTCINRGIKLSGAHKGMWLCEDSLLSYEETLEGPVNEKTCQYFEKADLVFNRNVDPLHTNKFGYCTNIRDLTIKFFRRATIEELSFLPKLQKLKKLKLFRRCNNSQPELINSTLCPIQVFLCRFPLLTKLCIQGNVFSVADQVYATICLCLPNLKVLKLRNLRSLPENVFVDLAKLETLEEMFIRGCYKNITDEMFIRRCESQRTSNGNNGVGEFVPAIAAFKNLKILHIARCTKLTVKCIVEGIARSPTLSFVSLQGIRKQLTKNSLAAMKTANFKGNQNFVFKR